VTKKLLVVFGVILLVVGTVLYFQAKVAYEDAVIARALTISTEEADARVDAHLGRHRAMQTGAFLCWAGGAIMLASGYLMKTRGKSPIRLKR